MSRRFTQTGRDSWTRPSPPPVADWRRQQDHGPLWAPRYSPRRDLLTMIGPFFAILALAGLLAALLG